MNFNFNFKQNIFECVYPKKIDKHLLNICKEIKQDFFLYKIKIIPKPLCVVNDCHNNVIKYIKNYGGEHVWGYYILQDKTNEKNFVFVLHSVVKKENFFLDITPVKNSNSYNIFLPLDDVSIKYKGIEYFDSNFYFQFL